LNLGFGRKNEQFEDAKGVTRSRKSKDRKYNDKRKTTNPVTYKMLH